MSLESLEIKNVRNIQTANITLHPSLNFVTGPNAGGKSSLLEAVYILGRGRSFRASQPSQVISFQQDSLLVKGKLSALAGGAAWTVSVKLGKQHNEIQLAGTRVDSRAELIQAFPVLVIHPASFALIDGAPKLRRQFIDWGAFQLNPSFLDNLRGYNRALIQRNALLRSGKLQGIEIWNQELDRYGTMVSLERSQYVQKLRESFNGVIDHFLPADTWDFKISQGFDENLSILKSLEKSISQDLKWGYTSVGPHKSDLQLLFAGKLAKNFLSRGQSKIFVYALLLAQAELIEQSNTLRRVTVLIDDLISELDRANQNKLLHYIHGKQSQFLISCTDTPFTSYSEAGFFQIDNGRIHQFPNIKESF